MSTNHTTAFCVQLWVKRENFRTGMLLLMEQIEGISWIQNSIQVIKVVMWLEILFLRFSWSPHNCACLETTFIWGLWADPGSAGLPNLLKQSEDFSRSLTAELLIQLQGKRNILRQKHWSFKNNSCLILSPSWRPCIVAICSQLSVFSKLKERFHTPSEQEAECINEDRGQGANWIPIIVSSFPSVNQSINQLTGRELSLQTWQQWGHSPETRNISKSLRNKISGYVDVS